MGIHQSSQSVTKFRLLEIRGEPDISYIRIGETHKAYTVLDCRINKE